MCNGSPIGMGEKEKKGQKQYLKKWPKLFKFDEKF